VISWPRESLVVSTVASLEKVRAEKLDIIEVSLKAGEPGKRGKLGLLYCEPWVLIQVRGNKESSGRSV